MEAEPGLLDPPPQRPPARSSALVSRAALDDFFDDLWAVKRRWDPRWRKVTDLFMPTRSRFLMADANKGDRGNDDILDNHGKLALNVTTAGLVNGMAPSTEPWFDLSSGVTALDGVIEADRWLTAARDTALLYLDRTNYYNKLGEQVRDGVMVGTGAKMILEDDESDDLFRVLTFPVGSFAVAEDARGRPNTFGREFTLTARQLVDEYGYDNCPADVRRAWDTREYKVEFEVRWLIYPNPAPAHDLADADPLARRFRECHWVHQGGDTNDPRDILPDYQAMDVDQAGHNKVLRVGGFHEFPISVIRWEKNEDDAYGTSCPGFEAAPIIKTLQAVRHKFWKALEKGVDPPMVGGPSVKNKPVSMLPGRVTIENEGAHRQGLRALHEIRINLDHVRQEIQDLHNEIDAHLLVPHFLSLHLQAGRPQMTAEEIIERRSEKNAILGPILERHADDVFDPDIDRVLNILIRASKPYWMLGLTGAPLAPPPEALGDVTLRPIYISEVAQAQKTRGLAKLERHVGWLLANAQVAPEFLDGLDIDEARKLHRDLSNASPRLSRTDQEVMARRMLRQQQQQAAMAAEAAPALARGARDMAEAPAGGESVLSRLAQVA